MGKLQMLFSTRKREIDDIMVQIYCLFTKQKSECSKLRRSVGMTPHRSPDLLRSWWPELGSPIHLSDAARKELLDLRWEWERRPGFWHWPWSSEWETCMEKHVRLPIAAPPMLTGFPPVLKQVCHWV